MNALQSTGAERLARARRSLQDAELDLLLVSPSPDLRYLLGLAAHASERPALLVLGDDPQPLLLLPAFEAAGLSEELEVRVLAYEETEDPYIRLRDALADTQVRRAALSDQTRAVVLLRLQETFPDAAFEAAGPLLGPLRTYKDSGELQLLAQAGEKADAAFRELLTVQLEGQTERALARKLNQLLERQGLEAANWGPVVGSGPNSASPHHTAGGRVIQCGDPVVLDFGGTLGGYGADITRTVHVGSPSTEFRRVYEVVRQAQELAVSTVRPGVAAEDVDRAARGVIDAAGYGPFFTHRTGHGIGLDVHEEPYIIEGNTQQLEAGMTFSVEPGIYLPGQFGVRIEDIVCVTEDGVQRMNNAPRELVVVR